MRNHSSKINWVLICLVLFILTHQKLGFATQIHLIPIGMNQASFNIKEFTKLGRGNASDIQWNAFGDTLVVGGRYAYTTYSNDYQQVITSFGDPFQAGVLRDSPDGSKITRHDPVAWEKIIVTEVSTGSIVAVLEHSTAAFHAGWSPDSTKLATLADDRIVTIWDITSGQVVRVFDGYDNFPRVEWSPDSTHLIINGVIWNLVDPEPVLVLSPFPFDAVWSPDGTKIAEQSGGRLRVWDAATGQLLVIHPPLSEQVTPYDFSGVTWSPDSSKLLTIVRSVPPAAIVTEGAVVVWSLSPAYELDPLLVLEGHIGVPERAIWKPDGYHIVSLGDDLDNSVVIWNATTGAMIRRLDEHTDFITSLSWSSDGISLWATSTDNRLRIWNSLTQAIIAELEIDTGGIIWNSEWTQLAGSNGGNADSLLHVWDVLPSPDFVNLDSPTIMFAESNAVWIFAWDPTDTFIASGGWGNTVWIVDSQTGNTAYTLIHNDVGYVYTPAWSPQGLLATGSDTGQVSIWNVSQSTPIKQFEGHVEEIHTVAWSPDGTRLATGSQDNTIRLWDASNDFQLLATLSAHTDDLLSLAWNPTSSHLASSALDSTVHIWDTTSGQSVASIVDNPAPINILKWNADGTRLAGGDEAGIITIWVNTSLNAATLIAPAGTITDPTPTYTWYDVSEATEFKLTVENAGGTVLQATYPRGVCSEGTCAVTPTTALPAGDYSWTIQTINAAGDGPVSEALNFTVDRRE